MINKKIQIEEYSPSWALEFEQLKAVYLTRLSHLIIDVQHVGSTSVVGLSAKPIIDVDLVINSKNSLTAVIEKLQLLGYKYMGDLGISDREAFKAAANNVPYDGSSRRWPQHHLYVCPAASESLKNHIAFRDFLRNNPAVADAYGNLKKRLALEVQYDMDEYVKGKTPFITEVLRQAGFDELAISRIVLANSNDNLQAKG